MKTEDRIEQIEEKLKSLEALYEGLHGAVSKNCENEFKPGAVWIQKCTCNRLCAKSKDGKIICDSCETPYQPDKPTQTLSQKFYEAHRIDSKPLEADMLELASIAEKHYAPLLQSEYQRGIDHGLSIRKFDLEMGKRYGRKQAIEELKEKFYNLIAGSVVFEPNIKLFRKIENLFTPDK